MKDGEIAEQGTYEELINAGKAFARLIEEYGEVGEEEKGEEVDVKSTDKKEVGKEKSKVVGEPSKALMVTEERSTGSVDNEIYFAYLRAAGGYILLPLLIFLLVVLQATNIGYVLRFFINNSSFWKTKLYIYIYDL